MISHHNSNSLIGKPQGKFSKPLIIKSKSKIFWPGTRKEKGDPLFFCLIRSPLQRETTKGNPSRNFPKQRANPTLHEDILKFKGLEGVYKYKDTRRVYNRDIKVLTWLSIHQKIKTGLIPHDSRYHLLLSPVTKRGYPQHRSVLRSNTRPSFQVSYPLVPFR